MLQILDILDVFVLSLKSTKPKMIPMIQDKE